MPDKKASIRCVGGMYSGATVLSEPRTATSWGWDSAVCDRCGTRLYLKGQQLPPHWLEVTIHSVSGPIHNPETHPKKAGK